MSQYLVERIRDADNVEVRLQTEVVAGHGTDHLEEITVADHAAGTMEKVPYKLALRLHRCVTAHGMARRRGCP